MDLIHLVLTLPFFTLMYRTLACLTLLYITLLSIGTLLYITLLSIGQDQLSKWKDALDAGGGQGWLEEMHCPMCSSVQEGLRSKVRTLLYITMPYFT